MKRLLAAALALVITALVISQVDPSRTVLTVNGEEIKGAEYYRRMEFLPGVGKRMGSVVVEFPPGFLTLEQLITERLVLQLAKQKGALPSDLEVDAEYNSRLTEQPTLLEKWKESGRTEAELRSLVRYQLAEFKIATFGITITDQEIDKHFKDNKARFTTPKLVKLRAIAVTSDEDRSAVDADLAGGKKFADVAKARSIDASRADGGYYGEIAVDRLATQARDAINATKTGQTTPWITSERGEGAKTHIKFLVEGFTAPKLMEMTPALRRQLRRSMMLDKGRVKNNLAEEMKAIRTKAKIDIRDPQFAEAYKRFVEAYLKQTGGAPAGGG